MITKSEEIKLDYSKELLDSYEKQIEMKLALIEKAINKKGNVIAPGIVQYDFDSFADLHKSVNPLVAPLCMNEYIFRGHSHNGYKLLPTVKRDSSHQNGSFRTEFELLTKFAEKLTRRNLPMPNGGQCFLRSCEFLNVLEEWIPLEVIDFVAYARHAGLSTRLLDWTYDFWTAVYFAASGILDEIRRIKKTGHLQVDFNCDDSMVIWLFNIAQWKELTDYTFRLHPYGLFDSNLHFTTPYYHDNANAYAQKGLLSYFSVKKDRSDRNSPEEILNDWDCKASMIEDNYTVDEYIAQRYNQLMTKSESIPNIPIMLKFTLPVREALKTINSLILLGYTRSSIYPSAENCVRDVQDKDDYRELEVWFRE